MDEQSVTRTSSPSTTRAIVADEAFCVQASALLACGERPVRDAFIGEPVEEVLEMVGWALSHEGDGGFDPAEVLTAWAKRRGRGAWSGRAPDPSLKKQGLNGRLADALARFWSENPHELAAVLDRVEASLRRNGSF